MYPNSQKKIALFIGTDTSERVRFSPQSRAFLKRKLEEHLAICLLRKVLELVTTAVTMSRDRAVAYLVVLTKIAFALHVPYRTHTLRTRVLELCARSWLNERLKRRRLHCGEYQLQVKQMMCRTFFNHFDGTKAFLPQNEEVIVWSAKNLSWFGRAQVLNANEPLPLVKLSQIDAELIGLHRRVLSRASPGSFKLRFVLDSTDCNSSTLLRQVLARLMRRILACVIPETECVYEHMSFKTGISRGRIMLNATAGTTHFSCSFKPEAENGTISIRQPILRVHSSSVCHATPFGSLALPCSIVENVGAFCLSAFALDTKPAIDVVDVSTCDDKLTVTVVSACTPHACIQHTTPQTSAHPFLAEWRLNLDSVFRGRAQHPFRLTFSVGNHIPWIFNQQRRVPALAVASMLALSCALSAASVPQFLCCAGRCVFSQCARSVNHLLRALRETSIAGLILLKRPQYHVRLSPWPRLCTNTLSVMNCKLVRFRPSPLLSQLRYNQIRARNTINQGRLSSTSKIGWREAPRMYQ